MNENRNVLFVKCNNVMLIFKLQKNCTILLYLIIDYNHFYENDKNKKS